MKIFFLIFAVVIVYVAFEFGLFWYKEKHLPLLTTPDQSQKTFGSGPPLRYIAAGDSTAAGVGASNYQTTYPYQIAEYFAKTNTVDYKNIAVPGARTDDVIKKQMQEIVAYNPDVITISIGPNDATHLASNQTIIDNFRIIISSLEKQTHAKIYITDIASFQGAKILPWFYILLLNFRSMQANSKILALQNDRTKIVDIYTFGWDQYPDRSVTFAKDNFHPNDIGYENWTNAFLDSIQKP